MNDKIFLIFFGKPGSGKGTQAKQVGQKIDLPIISTGEILRQEIKAKTQIGLEIEKLIAGGNYVSDELAGQLVVKKLAEPDTAKGAIFDGYPRTAPQQEFLIKLLNELGGRVFAVLIDVSEAEVLRRQGGRRVCINGHVFHDLFNPPQVKGVCDICQEALFVRDDDQPAAVQHRLAVFRDMTEPLFGHWRQVGGLIIVDGEQTIEQVQADIINALAEKDIRVS